MPENESYEPGGRITFATKKMVPISHGSQVVDATGLGRWSGLHFRGKENKMFVHGSNRLSSMQRIRAIVIHGQLICPRIWLLHTTSNKIPTTSENLSDWSNNCYHTFPSGRTRRSAHDGFKRTDHRRYRGPPNIRIPMQLHGLTWSSTRSIHLHWRFEQTHWPHARLSSITSINAECRLSFVPQGSTLRPPGTICWSSTSHTSKSIHRSTSDCPTQ